MIITQKLNNNNTNKKYIIRFSQLLVHFIWNLLITIHFYNFINEKETHTLIYCFSD